MPRTKTRKPGKPGNTGNSAKTGPKTPEGRAAVRHNALRHGVVSDAPVIPGEDDVEWGRFSIYFVAALEPEGRFERALAERAARLEWRIMRVERYEAELFAAHQRCIAGASSDPSNVSADWEAGLPDAIDRVQRYEAHLQRIQTTVLHELEAAQKRRRGFEAPLNRVDLTVASAARFPTAEAYAAALSRENARRGRPADFGLLGTFVDTTSPHNRPTTANSHSGATSDDSGP